MLTAGSHCEAHSVPALGLRSALMYVQYGNAWNIQAGGRQNTAAASSLGLRISSSWQRVPIDLCYITGIHAPVCAT